MRLGMDWRPLVGLHPNDAGTLVERVLAEAVTVEAVKAHNRDAAGR